MATAKQLAWRKKFAAMAKAGTLKKRKANPAKKRVAAKKTVARVGVTAKRYVKRPSQITRAAPTKRLVKRRTKVVAKPKKGYFPNPYYPATKKTPDSSKFPFQVQCGNSIASNSGVWKILACFATKEGAYAYARAYHKAHNVPVRVIKT